MKLPKITKQPIEYVDATPDADYPLRILRAYRANCDCQWKTTNEDPNTLRVLDAMNNACTRRAEKLDWAIAILRRHVGEFRAKHAPDAR